VPLVLDLALSTERTAHTWEEAFAEEIGRRHGVRGRSRMQVAARAATVSGVSRTRMSPLLPRLPRD